MVYSPHGPLAGQRAARETDCPILNLCIVMVRPRLGEWIVEPGSPRSRASRRCQRFLTVGRQLGIPHDTAGSVWPGNSSELCLGEVLPVSIHKNRKGCGG